MLIINPFLLEWFCKYNDKTCVWIYEKNKRGWDITKSVF